MTTTTAACLALAGLFVLAIAVPMLRKWRRLTRHGKSVTGILVDPRELTSAGPRRGVRAVLAFYRRTERPVDAVFRFTTEDGREVMGTSAFPTGDEEEKPGDSVVVRYDPADPEKAVLAQALRIERTVGSLLSATGAVLLIIGVIGMLTGA
ncbi:DUF3592 domain-containing protein [Actinomadura algeriensis]|uniref:DUF3592 domain-containing protein n=1 Tax=Actinomadura algeriensis TaxID=1679523 RepID=A0ABR9JZT8_9ACTN|nr:DUF3592 domain-containing protein [Actinomadura algeriensis]MBE1536091.1 hypothetical protein [Actinomadura algeriensis]